MGSSRLKRLGCGDGWEFYVDLGWDHRGLFTMGGKIFRLPWLRIFMFVGVLNWFRKSQQEKNPPTSPVPQGKTPEQQAEIWLDRGRQQYFAGDYAGAIASYDQALQIKPDDPEAWFNRGLSLDELGQSEAAIASYDQALQIKPDFPEAWFNRGTAFCRLSNRDDLNLSLLEQIKRQNLPVQARKSHIQYSGQFYGAKVP